jgi:hypothetical protein
VTGRPPVSRHRQEVVAPFPGERIVSWRHRTRRPGRPVRPVANLSRPLVPLEDRFTPANLWTPLTDVPPAPDGKTADLNLQQFRPYTLDAAAMADLLAAAPAEGVGLAAASSTLLALPRPDGTFAHFRIVNATLMEPGLAAQYPEIHTIRGQGVEDPTAVLSADITGLGFHAQVITPNGSYYVDPYWHLDTSLYASYYRTDLLPSAGDVVPTPDDIDPASLPPAPVDDSGWVVAQRSGTQLRTYRLAVAATGEYTQFFGGTVANGQSAIVTAINRVSGIMETELSIRLVLVAGNSAVVYTTPSGDPYSNNNPSSLLDQNQSNLDLVIGNANYDIGHVFSTGGGGLATLRCVGVNGRKAQGETGSSFPTGDGFYVDYVIHEMGHQFGASHTFNTAGDTSNRVASSAYEPGSGSTIMGYAGIEGSENLQAHSDPYYHSKSFDDIIAYVDNSIPNVGTRTDTGNQVPVVSAGQGHIIPTGTPFALTATGSDADADALTYNWEERDLGPAVLLSSADNGTSPIFRSFTATTSPTRTFPKLSAILNGTNGSVGEKLPSVGRSAMNFRVTVRDNRAGGGGVNTADTTLSVVNTGAAFAVTSPNSFVTWAGGSQQTVTWNVAGTTGNGINAAAVNVRLSTDGGNTFPIVLAAGTANDGSETFTVPANAATTTARIKVEPTDNVFFDISNANFTITAGPPTVAGVRVDDGTAQRSMVRSLTVTFSTLVTLPANPADAFRLSRTGPLDPFGDVTLSVDLSGSTGTQTVARLTFSGAFTQSNSLIDGTYSLTVFGSQVAANGQALDGDGDGAAGGDFGMNLYRLYGDADGNRTVNAADLTLFRAAFGGGDPTFDVDGDGVINQTDLAAFRTNFGAAI